MNEVETKLNGIERNEMERDEEGQMLSYNGFRDVTDYTCLWKDLQTLGCARLRTEYSQVIWRPKEISDTYWKMKMATTA